MKKQMTCLVLLFAVVVGIALPCAAQRYALVIGNSRYTAIPPLRNPVNDATMMAKTLKDLGFVVTAKTDLTLQEMEQTIRNFAKQIGPQSTVLFYFSGHGVQVEGNNYLLPVDIRVRSLNQVKTHAMNMQKIMDSLMIAKSQLNLIILDACRNNPFKDSTPQLALGFQNNPAVLRSGLAAMSAPAGTFIAYATAPGKIAYDGKGDHSPYTKYLLEVMKIPSIPIEEAFKLVRSAVQLETKGTQIPWESSSLIGDFRFVVPDEQPVRSKSTSSRSNIPTITINTDKRTYYEGERVRVIVETRQDCYLKIYNMNADGHVHIVFPNEWGKDNFIRAGQKVVIPHAQDNFEFIVSPPFGTERLWAECSPQQFKDSRAITRQGTGFLYYGQFSPQNFTSRFTVSGKSESSQGGILSQEVSYTVRPR